MFCDIMSVANHQRFQNQGLVDHDFDGIEHSGDALKVRLLPCA